MSATIARRRVKMSVTVDPQLLAMVDRYVERHPGADRSKVVDDALALWGAREQDRAMEAQFAEPQGVDPDEWESWCRIRDAATAYLLRRRREV